MTRRLVVGGARPLWLSAAFIIEEGCEIALLRRIVASMAAEAEKARLVEMAERVAEYLAGHDVAAVVELPHDTTLSLAVTNVFDRDPPPAQVELGYDPRAGGNALGRTFEIGIKKTF